jgi:integrase
LDACRGCRGLNEYYAPLAIHLFVDTGMRLDEMFGLTWSDVDLFKREIKIRKSKTDHVTGLKGRTIAMSFMVMFALMRLQLVLLKGDSFKRGSRIFPMSKGAFQQSWAEVRTRAKISDLTIRDLRREAASRFEEAGLTVAENAIMLGHKSRDITTSYISPKLKTIRDKLDRHFFKGKTLEEMWREQLSSPEGMTLTPKEIDTFHQFAKADPARKSPLGKAAKWTRSAKMERKI